MTNNNQKFLIKLFSGSHQGAEIELSGNECVIGSGEDCDVILSDALIAEEHVKINVGISGLLLTPLSAGVYYDGKLVRGDSEVIEPYKFISIGTTHFLVGLEGEVWPQITISDIPELEVIDDEGDDVPEPDVGAKPKGKEETVEEIVEVVVKKKKQLLPILLLSGIVAVVLVVVLALSLGSQGVVDSGFDSASIKSQAEGILKQYNASNSLDIVVDEYNEHVVISGYVQTLKEERVLVEALLQASPYIVARIDSEDALLSSLQETVSRYKLDVKIESMGLGSVKAEGYVQEKDDWVQVKRIIDQDVVGIKELKDEVITGDDIVATISKMVLEKEMTGDLIYIPRETSIQVLGNLKGEELNIWKEIKKDVINLYNNKIVINDNVRAAEIFIEQKKYFDAPIESVNIKNIGWLALNDGRRYYIGSTLPSGYVIEQVSEEGITLKKDDEEITLELGDL